MSFEPTMVGYEAGIVLWWNEFSHATVGVRAFSDDTGSIVKKLVFRQPTRKAGEFEVY